MSTFFHYYALHPFAKELTSKQKAFAFIGTIFLALPLGVGLIVCTFLHDKKIALNPDLKGKTKTDSIAEKVGVKKRSKEEKAKSLDTQNKDSRSNDSQADRKEAPFTSSDTSPKNRAAKTKESKAVEDEIIIHNVKTDEKRNFPRIIDKSKNPSKKQLGPLKQKFESDHPIMQQELLFHAKIRSSNKEPSNHIPRYYEERISRLENLPLVNYQTENFNYLSQIAAEKGEGKEALHNLDARILNRIAFLNEHVQFQERIDALSDHSHINTITLSDLELPWDISPLRIALLSDLALSSLSLSEISSFSKRQMEMLGSRLSILEKSASSKMESLKDINEITIGEFLSLPDNSQFIKKNFPSLSDQALMLIPERALAYLDLSTCSKERFCALTQALKGSHSRSERFSYFKNAQLYTVYHHFDEEFFRFISDNQIKSWDFVKNPLKKEQFNILFFSIDLNYNTPTHSKVRLLNGPQIHTLWPLFDANRAAQIAPSQMTELNVAALAKDSSAENKARFMGLFDTGPKCISESKAKAEKIGAKIYDCYHLLEGRTLLLILTKQQIQDWNFKQHPLSKGQFKNIFYTIDLRYNNPDNSKVRLLNGSQIHTLWSFFDANRAAQIAPSQITELNLGALAKDNSAENKARFKGLFDTSPNCISESRAKAEKIGEKIYDCYQLLEGNTLLMILTKQQIQDWDFKQHPLSNDQFENIFYTVDLRYNKPDHSKVRLLNGTQIHTLWPLFDANRAAQIAPSQMTELDLAALAKDDSEENKARFKGLFDTGPNCISESRAKTEKIGEKIYDCYHLLEGNTLLTILTKQQIQDWDFKLHPLTSDQFDNIFYTIDLRYNKPDHSKVRLLNGPQIHTLWSFFDMDRAALISAAQIQEMDLKELAKDDSAENRMRFIGLFDVGTNSVAESKLKSKNAGEAIYDCYQLIPGINLSTILNQEQIENWDFQMHPLNKDQFENIFPKVNVQDSYSSWQVTNHRIRFLRWDQLVELEKAGQMDKTRAACISKSQVEKMDLASQDILNFVINFDVFKCWAAPSSTVYAETIQRIAATPADQLPLVIKTFASTEVYHITNNQFKNLSFEDLSEVEFDFELFFPRETWTGRPPYKIQKMAIERLKALDSSKFQELLNCIDNSELKSDLREAFSKK